MRLILMSCHGELRDEIDLPTDLPVTDDEIEHVIVKNSNMFYSYQQRGYDSVGNKTIPIFFQRKLLDTDDL